MYLWDLTCGRRHQRRNRRQLLVAARGHWIEAIPRLTDSYLEWKSTINDVNQPPSSVEPYQLPYAPSVNAYGWHCKQESLVIPNFSLLILSLLYTQGGETATLSISAMTKTLTAVSSDKASSDPPLSNLNSLCRSSRSRFTDACGSLNPRRQFKALLSH